MRCLYCGTEFWLPARMRRDPDFCGPAHREKYKNRVDLALQRIQDSPAPPPVAEPMPVLAADSRAMQQEPAFIQIFSTPDTPGTTWHLSVRHAVTGIAAAIIAALVLWLSTGRNHPAAHMVASANTTTASLPPRRASSAPAAFRHPVAWLHSAASKRATWQLDETFENGMAAWGAGSNGWATGWAHSPEGFVRPGQLALFQPTIGYGDYRMDFLGQIENTGMSWVVRGKDTQNYYAMKFTILKPGLRPILSMTHYPVVEGRPGHLVEQPLSVMIHNGMPYHVSVEVKGNHYTASIEGEEVDSWSDDTLPAGGVGFFSETGARARIYWVKVSHNDDWLGWLCGHIAPVPPILPAFVTTPAFPIKRSN